MWPSRPLPYGEDETGVERELVFGQQDRPLVVRYRHGGSDDPEVSGSVVWLTFVDPIRN